MKPGEALKASEARVKANRARQKKIATLQAKWVTGSELTPEQLAEVQPSLKAQFLERESRRAA